MILRETVPLNKGVEYRFEHALNGTFVNHAVTLRADESGRVIMLRLNSAKFGMALWEMGAGLKECRAWESEEELEKLSYVSKHYQAPLIGQKKGEDHAREILDDCLSAIRNRYLIRVLLDFGDGSGRTFFDVAKYEKVQAELGPTERPRGDSGIARAIARRRAEREARARREARAGRISERPYKPPRSGLAYIAPPPLLILIFIGGYFLYSFITEPSDRIAHCCTPPGNSIEGVSISAICKRGRETEVRLYLHADSRACSRIRKTELTDYRGREYAPIRQSGIARCDTEGFRRYDAGHRFTWVFERLKDDVEFLRLREVVDGLKDNDKPPDFWVWPNLDLRKCDFRVDSGTPAGDHVKQ